MLYIMKYIPSKQTQQQSTSKPTRTSAGDWYNLRTIWICRRGNWARNCQHKLKVIASFKKRFTVNRNDISFAHGNHIPRYRCFDRIEDDWNFTLGLWNDVNIVSVSDKLFNLLLLGTYPKEKSRCQPPSKIHYGIAATVLYLFERQFAPERQELIHQRLRRDPSSWNSSGLRE